MADTTTKKDGTYTIKNLPPATYTVEFRDDDGTYVDEYYDDQRDIEDANDVPVAAGQTVSNIDAELEQTGSVSGTVTDEEGKPLQHLHRLLLPRRGRLPLGRGTRAAPPMTSAGTTVPVRGPGRYVIGFTDLSGTYVNEYYDDQLSIFDGELVPSPRAGHDRHRRRAGARRPPVGHRDRLRGQRPRRHRDPARHPPRRGVGLVRRGVRPTSPTTTAPTRSTACLPAPTGSSSSTLSAPTSPSSTTTRARRTRTRPSR